MLQFNSNLVNINEAWCIWKNNCLNILKNQAPKRVKKVWNKPAPWFNSEVKKDLLKKKAIKPVLKTIGHFQDSEKRYKSFHKVS